MGQAAYLAHRAEIEKAKRVFRNGKKDWRPGKLEGHLEAPANAKRLAGAGRSCGATTIEASLLDFFFHITEGAGPNGPRMMIRVKLAQLAYAAKEEELCGIAAAFCADGALRRPWLERVFTRRMARNPPQTRLRSRRVSLLYSEKVLRAHVSFRNSTMVRAAYELHRLACDM